MKQKLMAFLALWITIAFNFAQAQSPVAQINGLVLDEKAIGMEAATVALYSAIDSLLIKTILSEANGAFSFNGLTFGKYKLKISSMG